MENMTTEKLDKIVDSAVEGVFATLYNEVWYETKRKLEANPSQINAQEAERLARLSVAEMTNPPTPPKQDRGMPIAVTAIILVLTFAITDSAIVLFWVPGIGGHILAAIISIIVALITFIILNVINTRRKYPPEQG